MWISFRRATRPSTLLEEIAEHEILDEFRQAVGAGFTLLGNVCQQFAVGAIENLGKRGGEGRSPQSKRIRSGDFAEIRLPIE